MENSRYAAAFSEEILKCYMVQSPIGRGSYGSVYRALRRSDGLTVALKKLQKASGVYQKIRGKDKHLPLEVLVLKKMGKAPGCPYIIKLIEWIEEVDYLVLVLERPDSCKNLDEFISDSDGKVSESVAQIIMKQLVLAMKHCEDRGVLHRDLKPSNVLINPKTLSIKLIDFGCSRFLWNEPFAGRAGTPYYYAPEYFRKNKYFGRPTTVWTLGVVLYELLTGSVPFNGSKSEITTQNPIFPKDVSPACKNLLTWCLKKVPNHRLTLKSILQHRWLVSVELPDQTGASPLDQINGAATSGEVDLTSEGSSSALSEMERDSNVHLTTWERKSDVPGFSTLHDQHRPVKELTFYKTDATKSKTSRWHWFGFKRTRVETITDHLSSSTQEEQATTSNGPHFRMPDLLKPSRKYYDQMGEQAPSRSECFVASCDEESKASPYLTMPRKNNRFFRILNFFKKK